MLRAVLLIAAAFMIVGCEGSSQYVCYIYPDVGDLTEFRQGGVYDSNDECESACISQMRALNGRTTPDFECGSLD